MSVEELGEPVSSRPKELTELLVNSYRRARAEGYAMPREQAVAYALEDHD